MYNTYNSMLVHLILPHTLIPFSIYSEGAQLGSDDLVSGSGGGGGGGGGRSTGCFVFLFPNLTRSISSGLNEADCCLGAGAGLLFGAVDGVGFLTITKYRKIIII